MRKIVILLLALVLLATACHVKITKVPSDRSTTDSSSNIDNRMEVRQSHPDAKTITCRIMDGAQDGTLFLASENTNEIYRLTIQDIPLTYEDPDITELADGMQIEVQYSGDVMETYPAQFASVYGLTVLKDGMDDIGSLYLQVLEDLWDTDPGLNSDITELGVDLSGTHLTAAEQAAIIWAFGERHNLEPIQGTYKELVEQGYIDDENLIWDNGCLFSIAETKQTEDSVTFDAQKWRSGLGAYFFVDCTAKSKAGIWSDYEIGSSAIS